MFKLTVYHIALISILTALVIAVKYALGFVLGFELVTLLVVAYALFLPLPISTLICCNFVLITGIIYGFGTWWVVYWPIFLGDTFFTWTFKKVLKKNNFIFGFWCALLSFSILFYYSLSDYLIWGQSKALSQILTGWWVNLIGASGNFIVGIVILEPLKSTLPKLIAKSQLQKNKYNFN